MAKYDKIKDKHYLRARSFLIAVFEEDEEPWQRDAKIKDLLKIIRHADEQRLRR